METARDEVERELRAHVAAESTQDLEHLLEGMTNDCYNVVVGDPDRVYRGPEEVAGRYRAMWAAVPDLLVTIRRIVAVDGHDAVTEHTLTGTHVGSLFGIVGTGGPIEVRTVVLWELRQGRIRGETVYVDYGGLLKQAGLEPRPVAAPGSPA